MQSRWSSWSNKYHRTERWDQQRQFRRQPWTSPHHRSKYGDSCDQWAATEHSRGCWRQTVPTVRNPFCLFQSCTLRMRSSIYLWLRFIRLSPPLRMIGISKRSSKALCFVIDTTQSMSDDIEAVKTVTASIINSEVGTEDEPAVYILVPFNDPGRIVRMLHVCQIKSLVRIKNMNKLLSPVSTWNSDVGLLVKTTDSTVFQTVINGLSASGGGDEQEPSLSGLQVLWRVASTMSRPKMTHV